MPVITLQTTIKAEREVVFNLARSVDLHKISTEQTSENAIAGKTSGLMRLEDRVTWRAKHFGVWQNLTSVITEFELPEYFVDEMVSGAFKSFRHEHIFEDSPEGTLMTDIFKYTSPLGPVGKLADRLFLKQYMTEFLSDRNRSIKHFAESGKWKEVPEMTGNKKARI